METGVEGSTDASDDVRDVVRCGSLSVSMMTSTTRNPPLLHVRLRRALFLELSLDGNDGGGDSDDVDDDDDDDDDDETATRATVTATILTVLAASRLSKLGSNTRVAGRRLSDGELAVLRPPASLLHSGEPSPPTMSRRDRHPH